MDNWWKCCRCYREINQDVWGDTCPDCGHGKCDACVEMLSNPPSRPRHAENPQPSLLYGEQLSKNLVCNCNCPCGTCTCGPPPPPPPRPAQKHTDTHLWVRLYMSTSL
ncbi:hypothetical protein B0O99DRAFT_647112 [Bisporella sp. PMI_857]|nr:hypothetical protein B0O99DRAFT_647112 [Bisporella sp. PMI_857]